MSNCSFILNNGKGVANSTDSHFFMSKSFSYVAETVPSCPSVTIVIMCLILSFTFTSFAQDADMKARIKNEAQILSTAMETGDYETAASRLPADLLEKSGGIAGLKQSMEQAKGKSIKDTLHQKIGEVSSIAKAGQFTVAIVNTSMKIVSGSDTAIVKSYMVGISKDNGDNWVFLNGSDSVKERIIRKNPELATSLAFPVRVMTTGSSTYSEVNGRWVPDEKTYQDMKGTVERLQNGQTTGGR